LQQHERLQTTRHTSIAAKSDNKHNVKLSQSTKEHPEQCRIKTTWALAHWRNYGPPVQLETLALYSLWHLKMRIRNNWRKKICYIILPSSNCKQ